MKNEITHPLERYKLIADPTIRQQCINYFDKSFYERFKYLDKGSVMDAINLGFIKSNCDEHKPYWDNVIKMLKNGTLELLPEPIEPLNEPTNEPKTMFLIDDGENKVITDETLTLIKVSEIDQLRTENDRLQKALDFNVKENVNILRQFSEKITENEKLREWISVLSNYIDKDNISFIVPKKEAREHFNKVQQLLNK